MLSNDIAALRHARPQVAESITGNTAERKRLYHLCSGVVYGEKMWRNTAPLLIVGQQCKKIKDRLDTAESHCFKADWTLPQKRKQKTSKGSPVLKLSNGCLRV